MTVTKEDLTFEKKNDDERPDLQATPSIIILLADKKAK